VVWFPPDLCSFFVPNPKLLRCELKKKTAVYAGRLTLYELLCVIDRSNHLADGKVSESAEEEQRMCIGGYSL